MNTTRIKRVKPGDPISANQFNQIARSMDALSRVTGVDGNRFDEAYRKFFPFQPFAISVNTADDTWRCRFEPGYVLEVNIRTTTVSKNWIPTIGGSYMNLDTTENPLWLTIAAGDTVYCKFTTDAQGLIDSDPEITTTKPAVIHHYPPDPDDATGQDGIYAFEICEFEDKGDGIVGVKDYIMQDNFIWLNQLIQIENVGDEERVYKGFDPDSNYHELRTLVAKEEYGTGYNSHITEMTVAENGDNIEFSALTKLPGTTGEINFKDCNDNIVETLTWEKGLITSESFDVTLGDCETSVPTP